MRHSLVPIACMSASPEQAYPQNIPCLVPVRLKRTAIDILDKNILYNIFISNVSASKFMLLLLLLLASRSWCVATVTGSAAEDPPTMTLSSKMLLPFVLCISATALATDLPHSGRELVHPSRNHADLACAPPVRTGQCC